MSGTGAGPANGVPVSGMAGLWPAGWDPARSGLPQGPGPGAVGASLLLTVALPHPLQRAADAVRNGLWPQAARHAPAHVSLFRHLPGPSQPAIASDIRRMCRDVGQPSFNVGSHAAANGRWMAPIQSPGLDDLRAALAACWHGLLAPGDIAPPRLHMSLAPAHAGGTPPPALPPGPWRAPGLLLWQYAEASWTPLVAFGLHR